MAKSLLDNFDFAVFGQGTKVPFKGYVSSIDPTTAGAGVLIGGSQNTHKTLLGTIKVRDGLKRRGTANEAIAGVKSSYEWYTSLGAIFPLRVTEENKLQFESNIADGSTLVWYDLMTALDSTRFVFDTWWDDTLKKDRLIFVKFDNNLYDWQGGLAKLVSANTSDAAGVVATMALNAPGSGYLVNDVLTISGGGGTGATLTVTAISGTGAITAFTLTTRGSGYANTAGAATTGGAGTLATITITVATGEIGLDRDAAVAGFGPSGSVVINGTTYQYTSISGTSLLGVTPDPTAQPADSVVYSAVNTTATTPTDATDNFTNDFIKTVNNQLHVGSYTSRLIYVSDQDDFTDYTVPMVRAPGDPDLLTLDSQARGIAVQKGATDTSGKAVVSGGLGDWYTVTRSGITVGTTLTEQVDIIRSQEADLSTAQAHEFIDVIGDSVLFIDQNNQLREFGLVRNIVSPVFPLLSLDVYTELKGRNFTGGALRIVSDENDTTVYLTLPAEGIDYMYQIRSKLDEVGNLNAERLWNPPQVRGIARIAVIDGVTYGHSNANPQIYQLWGTGQYSDDSPSDEPVPYECHAIFAYISLPDRLQQLLFDKLYFEGYMSMGTVMYCNVYQEYQGSKNILTVTVNKPTNPGKKLAKFYSSTRTPSLGDVSLGLIPLGEGVSSSGGSNPPKFRAMRRVQAADMFEFALDLMSIDLDSEWEILLVSANIQSSTRRPTSIMGLN